MTLAPAGEGGRPPRDAEAGGPAPVVVQQAGEPALELLRRAGIGGGRPRPVIVVAGGADELREPHLSAARTALGPALRTAVEGSGAAVVDGGTNAGVMALLGAQRERDPESMTVLIGVAPAGRVRHPGAAAGDDERTPLAAHHTHFVLADSDEWGGETPLLASVAAELARGEPVVLMLVGGGEGALAEVEEAVRRRWPLFVVEGTGGIADAIAAVRGGGGRDPELEAKLVRGDFRLVGTGDPAALGHALAAELRDEPGPRDEAMLRQAWSSFWTYDRLAVRLRKVFERFQISILALGVVATAIAIVHDALDDSAYRDALRWLVIAAPISVSVLIALANRRDAGKRWVLVRAAAEAVKSEIYRYRTRTGVYSREALRNCAQPVDRPARLAGRLGEIDRGLIGTAASSGPLTPQAGEPPRSEGGDDGLGRLDAAGYVELRVAEQVDWYHGKVRKLNRRRGQLQLLTVLAGGVGTFLAAIGHEIWIGVTTALAGSAIAYLGYLQIDNTIVAYNRAAAQLTELQRDVAAGAGAADLERLVTRGEKILTAEVGAWVQQMTEALAELQLQQAEAGQRVEQQRGEQVAAP